jgi:2-polyprenyl-3-methyl-5-hydroxy-6-metoxy-1,4-benzoquinol methylase
MRTATNAGTAAQEVREAYSRWAATYDQDANRTRDLDQQVTRRLLPERHFARVLELGCGTGKNTAMLADIGAQVVAMDLVVGNLVLEHIDDLTPVFAQAAQHLVAGGMMLVSELHPFRQYQGTQARFADSNGAPVLIPAFQHHVSDYLRAARDAGLVLRQLDEWWHVEDEGLPPRLLSLVFDKP